VPAKARVVRGGQLREVEVSEVVPGDIVSLDEGDRLPADLRLIRAFEVSVDISILTGESEPQRRFVDMTPGITVNNVTDYHNILFAGTTLVTGVARGIVTSTARETQFGYVVALSGEIEEAVREAKRAGIKVIMITGDQELTAEAISKKVGIVTRPDHKTISGNELDSMSDEKLSQTLENEEIVFARTTPEHKLRVVKALISRGSIVGVTGDGVNDSPALMEADVGIAIGSGGTDVARESADIVLLDNDLTSIVEAVRLGRATYNNLRKFVSYIYTQNWAELLAFIVFVILRTPLPLLGIQELAIDLFLGVVPSLALIMEPPEADVMTKLPHSSGERLISVVMLTKSGIIGMVVGTGTILVAFSIWAKGEWFLGASTIIDPKIYAMGTTVVVTGIVAGQLGNLFATKDQL
jgi:P-type Ca2+ transporter type 2C